MRLPFNFDARSTAFVVGALFMVGVYVAVMQGHVALLKDAIPTWAMAVDLLVVLPLTWMLLRPREWRQRWLQALSLAGAGYLLGRFLAPEGDALWAALGQARWLALALVLLAELWLLSGWLRHVWRAGKSGNAEAAAAQSVRQVFGRGWATRFVLLESRLWVYALMRPPAEQSFLGDQHFGVHRQRGNASNQQGFVVLMALELPLAHVLLHLFFGATTAWVVTALSAYGWLFLWAEYRATRWRPVSLDAQTLHLRYGLLVDTTLSREAVLAVEALPARPSAPDGPKSLRLQGMGCANVRLRLRPGTRVGLLTGERDINEVLIGVDQPERFVQALSRRAREV